MFTHIYRFERDGLGPYRSRFEGPMDNRLLEILASHNGSDYHPTPNCDQAPLGNRWTNFGCRAQNQHVCGFSSLDQLNKWFTIECQELLLKEGFELRCIHVPARAIIHGHYQIVVHKKYVIR